VDDFDHEVHVLVNGHAGIEISDLSMSDWKSELGTTLRTQSRPSPPELPCDFPSSREAAMFESFSDLFMTDTAQRAELLRHRRQIELLREARISKNPFDTTKEDIASLQAQNAELRLYVAVLTRLLLAKKLIAAEELQQWLAAIDASDGTADGGLSGPILPEQKT
jgi:hypothetical protein